MGGSLDHGPGTKRCRAWRSGRTYLGAPTYLLYIGNDLQILMQIHFKVNDLCIVQADDKEEQEGCQDNVSLHWPRAWRVQVQQKQRRHSVQRNLAW